MSRLEVYNSLIKFNRHLDIYFSDIDTVWLKRYENGYARTVQQRTLLDGGFVPYEQFLTWRTARLRLTIQVILVLRTPNYVGHIKGVGHIYQQTFIDTYAKIGFAKLYDRKNALVAADILNDRVLPFYEQHDLRLLRLLTDRGPSTAVPVKNREYQLYLAIEDIDHTKIKAKNPQTNGICERFNRTVKNEFYDIALRKKIYSSLERPRCVDDRLQHKQDALRQVLLRQNAYAHFHRKAYISLKNAILKTCPKQIIPTKRTSSQMSAQGGSI